MTAIPKPSLVSVDDYLSGELVSTIKHEYVGGYVYAMAGARNVHNTIAGAFFGAVYTRLQGQQCRPCNSDTKVRVKLPTHTRFYYPDGMVVCDPNPDDDSFQDRPVVIAEVLSPSTRRTDEGEKRDAYQTIPTLSAYLLIESRSARVTVYRRTDDGFVSERYDGRDAVVALDAIGIRLPLAELYERVDFDAAASDAETPDDI